MGVSWPRHRLEAEAEFIDLVKIGVFDILVVCERRCSMWESRHYYSCLQAPSDIGRDLHSTAFLFESMLKIAGAMSVFRFGGVEAPVEHLERVRDWNDRVCVDNFVVVKVVPDMCVYFIEGGLPDSDY